MKIINFEDYKNKKKDREEKEAIKKHSLFFIKS